jgi:small subunit ribosomal protein S4
MANYTGPKAKEMRRFGMAMTNSPKYVKILKRHPNPPGQAPQGNRRRSKQSEYAKRLIEKQKLRYYYNVLEKQMYNYMKEAVARPGNSGTTLLQLLECRLDNVVHRLGFSTTIWGARQFVNHGHVLVNGKKVNIPSYRVQPGETISLAPKMRENPIILDALDQHASVPNYLTFDRNAMSGRLVSIPERADIPILVDERLIVEHYSRRV